MKKFAVVIHPDPEGGFWGEVPALPGCYSQGETQEELLDNLREAIAGTFEVKGMLDLKVTSKVSRSFQ